MARRLTQPTDNRTLLYSGIFNIGIFYHCSIRTRECQLESVLRQEIQQLIKFAAERRGMDYARHEFYYDLPQELIAQEPAEPRDHSRMLVMDKYTGELVDTQFYHVLEYLRPGDCLILNDSRVLPARLYGQRKETGAAVELLLLSPKGNDVWEVLAGPGRKAKPGNVLTFGGGSIGGRGSGSGRGRKPPGQVPLRREFLQSIGEYRTNAPAALHYQTVGGQGALSNGIFPGIGVRCRAHGRAAFYAGAAAGYPE